MKSRIAIAIRLSLVTLLLVGVVYPLAVTGIAALIFPDQARGSLVTTADGAVVGSALIGQEFTSDQYFHSRPSQGGYDGTASGPSNLGPLSRDLRAAVSERVRAVRELEDLAPAVPVPADLVCASASGLDPHISPEAAALQAPRVAVARNMRVEEVMRLVEAHTEPATFGFLGQKRVNVLLLNIALDDAAQPR
ncbi:MAG: potassium-transporting ATPase subunit KdpC [Actinobacteria bacterium]|nr:potassium-transporting ATPase subunit KdpC [Actinomycetota bacterium]